MRIHVILDQQHEIVAFVPAGDGVPELTIEPTDATHTLHEHVEVGDVLADLRGPEAVAAVRAHMHRHLGL